MMKARAAGAALLVALSACGDGATPTQPIVAEAQENYAVRVDKGEYRVHRFPGYLRLKINVTFINRTGETAWIAACHSPDPPVLDKLVGNDWVLAFESIVPACLGPPTVIAAESQFAMLWTIDAGLPGSNIHPQFKVGDYRGTYRLRWGILGDYDENSGSGTLLPLNERISAPFRIE